MLRLLKVLLSTSLAVEHLQSFFFYTVSLFK